MMNFRFLFSYFIVWAIWIFGTFESILVFGQLYCLWQFEWTSIAFVDGGQGHRARAIWPDKRDSGMSKRKTERTLEKRKKRAKVRDKTQKY